VAVKLRIDAVVSFKYKERFLRSMFMLIRPKIPVVFYYSPCHTIYLKKKSNVNMLIIAGRILISFKAFQIELADTISWNPLFQFYALTCHVINKTRTTNV